MKTNSKIKQWVVLSVAIIVSWTFPMTSNAQITYSKSGLSIQGAPAHKYLGLTIDKYLGMYWTCKYNNFFQLDLSPANPRIAGTGDEIVFYNSATSTFNSIQVANVYQHSDARAKTNIKDINIGLNTIAQLRPVSYNWKKPDVSTEKVAQTRAMGTAAYGPEDSQLQYGFLAQEVEQVLPDAVKTDKEGHKLINYTALIPLLVQSVQDLKTQIEEQQILIAELSRDASVAGISSLSKTVNTNKIISYSPNPTKGIMTFTISTVESTSDAYIVICNLSGVQEKRIAIPTNQSSIQVDLSSLNTGLHIASLVVAGKVCDSKQIIKN